MHYISRQDLFQSRYLLIVSLNLSIIEYLSKLAQKLMDSLRLFSPLPIEP